MNNDQRLAMDMGALGLGGKTAEKLGSMQQALQILAEQPGVTDKALGGMLSGNLLDSAYVCHTLARNAGWWTDLESGEPLVKPAEDLFNLISSEINEAFEGLRKGIQDDHLPMRSMLEVEIADAKIRIFDTAGGTGWMPHRMSALPEAEIKSKSVGFWLASANRYVFRAWELADRAPLGSTEDGAAEWALLVQYLGLVLRDLDAAALVAGVDVQSAMIEKLAYNVNRADHRPEVRAAEGGKKL